MKSIFALITLCNTLSDFCKKEANRLFLVDIVGDTVKFRLHPLIHPRLVFNLAQDVDFCQDMGLRGMSARSN